MSKNKTRISSTEDEKLEKLSANLQVRLGLETNRDKFLARVKKQVEIDRKNKPKREIKGLVNTLKDRSRQLLSGVRFHDVGTVYHIGNGVATVSGLPNVSIDEIVTFPTGIKGMALNLDKKSVDLIMLGSEKGIRGGDLVQATGNRLRIPVGSQLLGRIIAEEEYGLKEEALEKPGRAGLYTGFFT